MLVVALLLTLGPFVSAEDKDHSTDPHYTKAGFFDVHYCHWSDQPNFFLILFGTNRYSEIKEIVIFTPDNKPLVKMDLNRYRLLERKNKPPRRVFVKNVPSGENAQTGWYTAKIALKDGSTYEAKDFVYIISMDLAKNISPADKSENIAVPKRFSWDPIPGAMYYKVFIKDMWGDGKQIFDSGLLSKPYVDLPKDLLKKGGWYEWSIHARDVNEHVLLGDFNHGSHRVGLQFTTAE